MCLLSNYSYINRVMGYIIRKLLLSDILVSNKLIVISGGKSSNTLMCVVLPFRKHRWTDKDYINTTIYSISLLFINVRKYGKLNR